MLEEIGLSIANNLPTTSLIIFLLVQNHKLLGSLIKLDQAESIDLKTIKKDLSDLKKQIGLK